MSRIRSIHPGFFTDEDIVSVSMGSRLLFLGLGVEADDKGIFEWKPLTIKMRVFPGDNVDVVSMLDELESCGAIRRHEVEGKSFGAIRNFRKFQKPKTPNDIYPATAEMRAFVGLTSEITDDEQKAFPQKGEALPQKGEIAPQMEDGGGRGGEGKEEPSLKVPKSTAAKPAYAFRGRVVRLTQKDFDHWRDEFHAIPDFRAELSALDGWLAGQPPAKQKNWFGSAAPWLNKRHQEALERAKPQERDWVFSSPA